MNDATSDADMEYYYSVLSESLTAVSNNAESQLKDLQKQVDIILAAEHMGPIVDDLGDI